MTCHNSPDIGAEIKTSREAINVNVLALVLFVIAPETVMSLEAETDCKRVIPVRLLALTVSEAVVLRISALLVMVTD